MVDVERLLDGIDPETALAFFVSFARFESALLTCGLLAFRSEGDRAQVDRRRLAKELGAEFFEEVLASRRATTLIDAPPKKLIVTANLTVEFGRAPQPLRDTSQLVEAVWRVRNNLFHGNKLHHGNRERDKKLMQEALWVISFVMEKRADIRDVFERPLYA
jgi:hypothetical protein